MLGENQEGALSPVKTDLRVKGKKFRLHIHSEAGITINIRDENPLPPKARINNRSKRERGAE